MAAPRARQTASNTSQASTASAGMGEDLQALAPASRDHLPPNLTPEGLSLDPNIKLYDTVIYFIYCPEHEKIVVTNVQRARCVFLPFICLAESTTWQKACKEGVNTIIGNSNPELDAKIAALMTPEFEIAYLNILRLQTPITEKFITRLASFVLVKKVADRQFQCCQPSPRINWVSVSDILENKIDKVWGPELFIYTKMLVDKSLGGQESITSEFTLKNSLYYLLLEDSDEQALLKACQVKTEHILEIYEDYLEHCYPSFFMCFESFRIYMAKYGYNKRDAILKSLFRTFSLFGREYLEFHEVLLGIVAMEPGTAHTNKARVHLIFRFYDRDRSGCISADEVAIMVKDIYQQPQLSGAQLEKRVAETSKTLEMNEGQISKESFTKVVLNGALAYTNHVCRSPRAILPQISRFIQIKLEGKTKTMETWLKSGRKGEGTCAGCKGTEYEYSLHAVTLDTIGRCVEPRIVNEDWIQPCPNDMMNLHKYSIEYVFSLGSVPNTFLDIIKHFYYKCINPGGETSVGLMCSKQDWTVITKYVTILCSQLKALLTNEKKLIKTNSPAIVIGDLQGNLHDLFEVEKHFFQGFPVLSHNLIFLGNYSGVCRYGMEVIFYLFALKMCSPTKVFLLRGTNEMRSQNRETLLKECHCKYGEDHGKEIFDVVNDIFQRLPFAVIVDETIFCAHSGISKSNKISKLNLIKGDVISVLKDAPVAYDLLVNTPLGLDELQLISEPVKSNEQPVGKVPSQMRQHYDSMVNVTGFQVLPHSFPNAYTFDETAFANFMRANGFRFFIRSHTAVAGDGYDLRFSNRCITIFSCSNHLIHLARNSATSGLNKPAVDESLAMHECTVAMIEGTNNKIRIISFNTSMDGAGNR